MADEEDALEAIKRFGARRGEVWTRGELELVARLRDQAIRDEIEALKRKTDGSLCPMRRVREGERGARGAANA